MTSDLAERRSRRRASQQLFDELAAGYTSRPDVTRRLIRMRAGRREMRQWIGVPAPDSAGHADRWEALIDDAYRYAVSLRSP